MISNTNRILRRSLAVWDGVWEKGKKGECLTGEGKGRKRTKGETEGNNFLTFCLLLSYRPLALVLEVPGDQVYPENQDYQLDPAVLDLL
jgi:hypothetical protein